MSNQTCKKCGLPNKEYYPGRKTCKTCIRDYQLEYQRKKYSMNAQFIKCVVCKVDKDPKCFKISKTPGKLKDRCIECKIPKFLNMDRYRELENWVTENLKIISLDDVRALKHIFEKL